MRISDCSSDVCSSDLAHLVDADRRDLEILGDVLDGRTRHPAALLALREVEQRDGGAGLAAFGIALADRLGPRHVRGREGEALGLRRRVAGGLHLSTSPNRSEEHTSELQSLMRISYAVFCLKKKK